jgi:hypothetical protein
MKRSRAAARRRRRERLHRRDHGVLGPPQTANAIAGLRIGYVNSQGLKSENWKICQRWIEDGDLDLLFVAET